MIDPTSDGSNGPRDVEIAKQAKAAIEQSYAWIKHLLG